MTIKELRKKTGMSQAKFATYFGIPVANIQKWEQGATHPPEYVMGLLQRVLVAEGMLEKE